MKNIKFVIFALVMSLLFVACNGVLEIADTDDVDARNTIGTSWNFQASASGLTDYATNGNRAITTDVAYQNSMRILGSQRDFRWQPNQASPGGNATRGMIQTGGATASGRYFLEIANVQGPFRLTLIYTDTGSSNSGRTIEFFTNTTSRGRSAGTSGLNVMTHNFDYTATDRVTVRLGCSGGIRLYDLRLSAVNGGSSSTNVLVTGITLSSGNFNLDVGATRSLTATVAPTNATNRNVTWSSSNTAVATVNASGVVTGVAAGTATITARAADSSGRTATVTATVVRQPLRWNFQASATGLTDFATNGSRAITADVAYQNGMTILGSQRDFRWQPNAATPGGSATRGNIQTGGATSSGRYFLQIANLQGPFSVVLLYTDTSNSSTGRTISYFTNGTSRRTSAGTNGANLVTDTFNYTGTDRVTLQLGCSGGIRLWDVTVNFGASSGGSTTTPSGVLVTGITLSSGNFSLAAGSTRSLTATVAPTNATNRNVTWSSSNTAVATVNASGVVTGVAAGTATITARAADTSGRTASVTATITGTTSGGSGSGSTGSGTTSSSGSVSITRSQGWLESLFVQWNKVSGAASYRVEWQRSGTSTWTRIDDPLIREYSNHFRADIVGLSAGTYNVRVATVNSSGTVGSFTTTSNISVQAHMRTGFAFSSRSPNRNSSGAYNNDGTLRSGAQVIYVTARNARTVALDVRESASRVTRATGIGNILKLREKGQDTTPLAIRFIGRIDHADISDQLGSNALLQVKGRNSTIPSNITVEGIGNDTVAYGWGILVRNSLNVEVRNMGFMMFPEDGIELNTDNQNIWVHNNDFFYGRNSGGDKTKGDGSLDIKRTGFTTLSFNHFWDAGKSSLLGNGVEPEELVTYHHNWFNHSDSRHPRVRFHSVHVFNNLYDGISKYGIGATRNSSIFVEANYFRNTRNPMLISMQGTDIANGSGTFSSEDGGIIKSFNNRFDGTNAGRAWSSSNTVEFDFWEAPSRTAQVPNTVRTKRGNFTYNNFDQNLGYSYTADSPDAARTRVQQFAGRMQGRAGSDFTWWNWTAADASSDAINSSLNSAIMNYRSGLVAVQSIR